MVNTVKAFAEFVTHEDIAMHMFPDYFINAAIWPFISMKKPEASGSKAKRK